MSKSKRTVKSKKRSHVARGRSFGNRSSIVKSNTQVWAAEFQNRLLDTTLMTLAVLRKYKVELATIICVSSGLIGLFAILDISSGVWTDAFANSLSLWLGWGAIFVPIVLLLVGFGYLAYSIGLISKISWLRVIFAEIMILALLGTVHLWATLGVSREFDVGMLDVLDGGDMIIDALDGRGGGKIGWFVAFIAVEMLGDYALLLLSLLCMGAFFVCSGMRWDLILKSVSKFKANIQQQTNVSSTVNIVNKSQKIKKKPSNKLSNVDKDIHLKNNNFTTVSKKSTKKSSQLKRSKLLPSFDNLAVEESFMPSVADVNRNAKIIEHTLEEFGVPASVVDFRVGPVVTQFAVQPGFIEKTSKNGSTTKQKVRVKQISRRISDLTLALSAQRIRIEAPVPGQSYVGIEVPNSQKAFVSLRGVLESESFNDLKSNLGVALGRDVSGDAVSADLGTMPHLLIAGTTGSGKSVCITSIISCLLCNNSPDDLRLVMVDPKKVELVRFNGLPHLLGKVEVELDRILGTLRWMTREMDRRYRKLEKLGARDLDDYNNKIKKNKGEVKLPRIVVVIDELADLMMMAQNETEQTLVRLAQMARATGIHLVVATQRPSTDILTGTIKANFPTRISFAVASAVDSRVILDTGGAEALLGQGDMLYLGSESSGPVRIQGVMIPDNEVDHIVNHWIKYAESYQDLFSLDDDKTDESKLQIQGKSAPWDELIKEQNEYADKDDQIVHAIAIVKKKRTASASLLQRKLKIGYPRAARLMDELYEMGVVGAPRQGGKTREVLIKSDEEVNNIIEDHLE